MKKKYVTAEFTVAGKVIDVIAMSGPSDPIEGDEILFGDLGF